MGDPETGDWFFAFNETAMPQNERIFISLTIFDKDAENKAQRPAILSIYDDEVHILLVTNEHRIWSWPKKKELDVITYNDILALVLD